MKTQFFSLLGRDFGAFLKPARALALMLIAGASIAAAPAQAETRTLKLYFIHTKERAEITFKKNGRYIPGGLQQVNRFLRDWRRNEPTKMDPRLLDLVWEAYRAAGARDYIHVVSAYRSPATNSMLRSRSRGVAKTSQHMLGKAMDFYIPGVRLASLRNIGLQLGGGGVGYYPTSGSPFVHFDVGSVRHWPRMSRKELVAVFPQGKTMHVPSDGKPLPGYEQAVAAYQSRQRGGSSVLLASNTQERRAPRNFLSALFGGGADEEEESGGSIVATAPDEAPRSRPRATVASAARSAPSDEALPGIAGSRPAKPVETKAAEPEPAAPAVAEPVVQTPEQIIAALPPRSVPLPLFAPRPKVELAAPVVAAAAPAAAPAAPVPPAAVEAPVEVAANVPLPMRRPEYKPVVVAAVVPVPQPAVPAPAAAPQDVAAVVPAQQPAAAGSTVGIASEGLVAAINRVARDRAAQLASVGATTPASSELTLNAYAPVPQKRPSTNPMQELVAVAVQPQSRPSGRAVADDKLRTGEERSATRVTGSIVKAGDAQPVTVAALSPAETDKQAIAARSTAKAAKPGPADAKGDRQAVIVPTAEIEARWALETAGRLTRSISSAKSSSLASNVMRVAPKQVYSAGFAPVAAEPDPARFAGDAAAFLPTVQFGEN